MIVMLESFLACLGVALFFGLMLAELRSIISKLTSIPDDEDIGAPEGDQCHFRAAGDRASHSKMPVHQAK